MPRFTGIKFTCNLHWNVSVRKWLRENISIPVWRRSAEAAPYTYFTQPRLPNSARLADECSQGKSTLMIIKYRTKQIPQISVNAKILSAEFSLIVRKTSETVKSDKIVKFDGTQL